MPECFGRIKCLSWLWVVDTYPTPLPLWSYPVDMGTVNSVTLASDRLDTAWIWMIQTQNSKLEKRG